MRDWNADPVLVEVVRGGLVECVHRGSLVITAADGTIEFAVGSVDTPMYPRSSLKPLQALAMMGAGLDLQGELLALASASHAGEAFHLEGAAKILAGVDRGVESLQTPPDYPSEEAPRTAWIRAGHGKEPVAMNCSGKHAAMIRTCVRNGWSESDYLDPAHPLQQAVAETITRWTGETLQPPTVDGCGAPLFAVSLAGLARAFGAIAAAEEGDAKVFADAVRDHPEWISGTGSDERALHRAVPGLLCKGGAEGVHVAGLPDGRAIALKIDDGAARGAGSADGRRGAASGVRTSDPDRTADRAGSRRWAPGRRGATG